MAQDKETEAELVLDKLKSLNDSPLCSDIGFHIMIGDIRCAEIIVRRIPYFARLDLKVLEVETQVTLVPFGKQRRYILDSVIKARSQTTGKDIYINIEMQNKKYGTQLERTRLYQKALKMYLAESGTSWNDFPEVITVMFANHIPVGNKLLYYEDGIFGEGASKKTPKELIPCGKPRVIYINMNLDKAKELLENRPDLRQVAEIIHDLKESKSCNMIITETREYKKNIEQEVHMFEIGNKYPIDRLVNRLLKENTESVTAEVTESVTATYANNLYRKGIDIANIASYLDKTESEIKKYLSSSLE